MAADLKKERQEIFTQVQDFLDSRDLGNVLRNHTHFLCENTQDPEKFSNSLVASDAMTRKIADSCMKEDTLAKQNAGMYKHLMQNDEGINLAAALQETENYKVLDYLKTIITK